MRRRVSRSTRWGYDRERFEELAQRSLGWIERELNVAQPRLVVTLGSEVAGIVRSVKGQERRNALLGGAAAPARFGRVEVPTVHLAHPGIVMRKGDARNAWPKLHAEEHIPRLRRELGL